MALEPEAIEETVYPNVLLYGPEKTGKSGGAASAPKPLMYLNADRRNALKYALAKQPDITPFRFTGLQTLTDATNEVKQNPGKWRTVVLDPVSGVYRTIVEELSRRALRPQLQLYGDANTYIERWCREMCDLDVNLVVVCHDLKLKDETTESFIVTPFTGSKSNPVLGNQLKAMVDVIGYTAAVIPENEERPRYVAQLIPANGRSAGDRFDCLVTSAETKMREVDLTEWFTEIAQSESAKAKTKTKEGAKT